MMSIKLNHTIYNAHGYGTMDLNQCLLQCKSTISNVVHFYPKVDKMDLLADLLSSDNFKPLYDRSVKLYTEGLVSFTNKYIIDNRSKLELTNNNKTVKYADVDADVFNNCMRYVICCIWYRGLTVEDVFKYLDLNKVVELVCTNKFKFKDTDIIKSDLLLESVLSKGYSIADVPDRTSYEVKRIKQEYTKSSKCVSKLTRCSDVTDILKDKGEYNKFSLILRAFYSEYEAGVLDEEKFTQMYKILRKCKGEEVEVKNVL